jgi:hypothetical protein
LKIKYTTEVGEAVQNHEIEIYYAWLSLSLSYKI